MERVERERERRDSRVQSLVSHFWPRLWLDLRFCATMRLAAESSEVVECSGGESTAAAGEDGGAVVVVGVKVDTRSKELLTWALVKVAQTGDRVIALHVLNPNVGE